MGSSNSKTYMSPFQVKKAVIEFRTFFDLNKDGNLTLNDFDEASKKICDMSGWKDGDEQSTEMKALFKELWSMLNESANEDGDSEITEDEWCQMWDHFYRKVYEDKADAESRNLKYVSQPPGWMDRYCNYKFSLLDRTRNNEIDIEEYEYVMQDFGVKPKDARKAFKMMTEDTNGVINKMYFRELCIEYFLSNDETANGTFINGVTQYDEIEITYKPSKIEKDIC